MKMRGFGILNDGRRAGLFVLRNSNGMEASVSDYGATLVSLMVPDRKGKERDVVLGHSDVSEYEEGHGSIGAVVGRFANRIGGAAFKLNGKRYQLTANNGPNCLHGGCDPYSKRLWQVKVPFTTVGSGDLLTALASESISDGRSPHSVDSIEERQIIFCLDSPDGDQGFPGNLHLEVTYTLTDKNELHIDYSAVCDADTPFNPTNHSYFNLSGHDSGSVLPQICGIRAERFTPIDRFTLPTGEIRSVAASPMDFSIPKALGAEISADYAQIEFCGGYDHNYVLDGEGYREVAMLASEESGISMVVLTDMPGMQLYTANGMNDITGKGLVYYGSHSAVCFETQFFPDAVNRDNFPGGILKAGEHFTSRTTYRF